MAHPARRRRAAGRAAVSQSEDGFDDDVKLPEENILYFLEKNSPELKAWQREVLRIVRNLAQYFYPQRQTKVMNEGCATFVHYTMMNRLHEKGLITDGSFLEFVHSHTSVVFQPGFDDRRYYGINPYALGFGMMSDIKRIVTEPDGRGSRLVSADRGRQRLDGRAEGRVGELSRRKLHRAVPVAQADARHAPLRAARQVG